MALLNSQQIKQLLSESAVAGLDADELSAVEETLLNRAADLSGAERMDMALSLIDETEARAADRFMVEVAGQRKAAIARGTAALKAMTDKEWEGLING